MIIKPKSTSHCVYCDECIYLKDHHCFILGNCIGGRNYHLFICYLLLYLFISLLELLYFSDIIITFFNDDILCKRVSVFSVFDQSIIFLSSIFSSIIVIKTIFVIKSVYHCLRTLIFEGYSFSERSKIDKMMVSAQENKDINQSNEEDVGYSVKNDFSFNELTDKEINYERNIDSNSNSGRGNDCVNTSIEECNSAHCYSNIEQHGIGTVIESNLRNSGINGNGPKDNKVSYVSSVFLLQYHYGLTSYTQRVLDFIMKKNNSFLDSISKYELSINPTDYLYSY